MGMMTAIAAMSATSGKALRLCQIKQGKKADQGYCAAAMTTAVTTVVMIEGAM